MEPPIVIVGGGPAGLSTAMHLRSCLPTHPVIVLERGMYPRDKICAGAIAGRALPLLANLGVDLDRAVPSVRIDRFVVQIGARTIAVREPECARVVRRIELDHALARAAMQRDIDVRTNARVTGIRRGRELRVELGDTSIAASIVIGADGIGGIVRRALGLPRGDLRAQAVEVDTPRVERDEPADTARFVFDAELRGYRWDFPTPLQGTVMMSRGAYQLCDDDRAHDPRAHLRAHLATLELALDDYAPRQFAERGFVPHAPASAARVLLVGEAAGIDFPTGEGIAQALLYGAIAAPYIAARLATRQLDFIDWPRAITQHAEGRFLARRHRFGSLLFGRRRALIEAALASSPNAWSLLLRRFAGRSLSRRQMVVAAFELVRGATRSTTASCT